MNRRLAAAAVASALMVAGPAAVAYADPAPPMPAIHCTVSGGTTLTLMTKSGDVELSLPAGARLDGHGTLTGMAEVADDLNANASPPAMKPEGPAMHGVLTADVDLEGAGCKGVVLPAGAAVDLDGAWSGGVFVIHDANFHAAGPVLAKGAARLVLGASVTVVIVTATGSQTVTLPAGTVIEVAGNRTGFLKAAGGVAGLYELKLPAGFMLNLVGVPGGTLVSPATLTLKFVGGTGVAANLPPSGTGTLTIVGIPPAPPSGSGTVTTVPVSVNVATTAPGSSVASGGGTPGTTSTTSANANTPATSSTTAPGTAVASSANASGTTSTAAAGTTVASASNSGSTAATASATVLPKTGGNPADAPIGLALIGLGGLVAIWPVLRRRHQKA